ncbi:MAG TPA: hypothetical protein VGA50_11055 [Kiloniellales bacterium]
MIPALDTGRRAYFEWARGHAGGWQLPAMIVLAQLVLYRFAQPGSSAARPFRAQAGGA